MDSTGSVTHWVRALKAGDVAAAQKLWERYVRRLVALARKRLHGARRRGEDEDDAALSAFDSFCRGAQQGRFPQLADRNDLWRLLVVITARKAIDLVNRERRLKHGGGKVSGESVFATPDASDEAGIEQVVGPEPTPAFAVQVAEEYQQLLDRLDDDELRRVAVWRMEGHTNEEIAGLLGCAVPTVERRLRMIRKRWEGKPGTGPPP
jgi:DNA-directed RNA polymerase specialized sigma24 family protein